MGHVYFAWLFGLLLGMIGMNLIMKVHPTSFAFLMSLMVLIAWILYYFVKIRLTNYNTRKVSQQLKQIGGVAKKMVYFSPALFYKVPQLVRLSQFYLSMQQKL